MALRLYLGLGRLVASITFVVEYLTNIRPTRHWREVVPVIIDEITTPFADFLLGLNIYGAYPANLTVCPIRNTSSGGSPRQIKLISRAVKAIGCQAACSASFTLNTSFSPRTWPMLRCGVNP